MLIRSHIDKIDDNEFVGWAYVPDDPLHRVVIELHYKGKPLRKFRADSFRVDLQKAGFGDGYCSFTEQLPPDVNTEEIDIYVCYKDTRIKVKRDEQSIIKSGSGIAKAEKSNNQPAVYKDIKTSVAVTNYTYNISKRNKLLYVEVPKAACSTIKFALQNAEVDKNTPQDNRKRLYSIDTEVIHNKNLSPLLSPEDDLEVFNEAVWGSYFRFTFVRNPYTRALSSYLDKIGIGETVVKALNKAHYRELLGLPVDRSVSFYEYLLAILYSMPKTPCNTDHIHWMPQATLLSINAVSYNFIGRMENSVNDFKKLSAILGIDFSISIQPHATNAREHVDRYYTNKEEELVRHIYYDDFKLLAYGFDRRMA